MPGIRPPGHLRDERRRRRRRDGCRTRRPGSERSVRQSLERPLPRRRRCGACSRPSRYAKVVSSGAIIPARAPHSIDMLQIVIRSSIESARIASPGVLDDVTDPAVDADAGRSRRGSCPSAVRPGGSVADELDAASSAACCCGSVWVASTCSTSEVPIPKASAPKAPWVEVWLSPQTIVIPGLRQAELGPDHVDDALASRAGGVEVDAELLAVRPQRVELRLRHRVGDGAREASARCGPSSRRSARGAARAVRRAEAPRTPAAR